MWVRQVYRRTVEAPVKRVNQKKDILIIEDKGKLNKTTC